MLLLAPGLPSLNLNTRSPEEMHHARRGPGNLVLVCLRRIDGKVDRLIENVQDLKHRVTSLEEQVAGLRSETAEHSWGHGGDVSQARSHRTAARPSKWQTQAITFGLFSVMHAHTDSPIALAWSHRGFCGSPGNMSVFRPASCLAASPLQWPLGRRSLSGSRTR